MKIKLLASVICLASTICYAQVSYYQGPVTPFIQSIGGSSSSSGTSLPPNSAGALTNLGDGTMGWLPLSSFSGGGTSLPTNGFDGQTFVRSAGGVLAQTNIESIVGYGIFTNTTVVLLEGDSLTSDPAGGGASHPWGYYFTNLYAGSSIKIGTNGAVAGKTTATIVTEVSAFLAPWGASGSTNKVYAQLSSVNDFRAHATADVVFSNYNRCLFLAKQSNCTTIAFTIQGANDMVESDEAQLNLFNAQVVGCTNADYVVMLHKGLPPPLCSGMYIDNVHPNDIGQQLIGYYVNQVLLRGRNNLLFPFYYTPSSGVKGSGTTAVSLGNFVGQGQYAGIAFYRSGTDIAQFLKYPGYVDIDYNPSGISLTPEAFTKIRLTATNLTFPVGFGSLTNVATASTAITFPATTVKWTNTAPINIVLYIDNSGVTGTTLSKNGQQIFSSLVGDMTLIMKPGDYFSETYTVGTPTARWEPQ